MDFSIQFDEVNRLIRNKLFTSARLDINMDLFFILLRGIKERKELALLFNEEILEKLIFVLEKIENNYRKAVIINSILFIMDTMKYDYKKNRNYMTNLFQSYLTIIEERGWKEIKDTLHLFFMLGIDKSTFIQEMCRRYDEKKCVKFLLKLGIDFREKERKEFSYLSFLYEQNKRMLTRFDVVFHFYLLTDPDYMENIDIAGEYLEFYGNKKEIFTNWKFSSQGWDNRYVRDGIISKEEEAIFIEIGDIYNRCVDHFESFDLEVNQGERVDNLKVMLDRFTSQLRKKEVQDLVKRFFHGKTVFEIAFSLPISETDNI